MHIVDGVLSLPVIAGGTAISMAGVKLGLKKMDYEQLPLVGLLSAVFFVASYIHLPVGFSSVHLILNGLMGLVLGWAAFPALLVGLLLQAVFFGFGGFVVLGVNTLNIALPAVAVHYLCRKAIRGSSPRAAGVWGGIAGMLAIVLTTLQVAFSLALSGDAFVPGAKALIVAHLPVMVLEAAVTAAAIMLLRQLHPDFMLDNQEPAHGNFA